MVIVFGKGDAEALLEPLTCSGVPGHARPCSGRRRRRRDAPVAGAHARLSGEVGLASLANGIVIGGVMVSYADMPATMLLCLRMTFAAAALGLVVLATGSWRDLRTPGARRCACSASASRCR